MNVHRGSQNIWGCWVPPPWDAIMDDPLEKRVSTTCVTTPNSVILGEIVQM